MIGPLDERNWRGEVKKWKGKNRYERRCVAERRRSVDGSIGGRINQY